LSPSRFPVALVPVALGKIAQFRLSGFALSGFALLPKSAQCHAGFGHLRVLFDQAEDVAERGIGIEAQQCSARSPVLECSQSALCELL
jgi:hypothetical protein